MTDDPYLGDHMEDAMAIHLHGFGDGREYERKQIVEWLRDKLHPQDDECEGWLATTIARLIEAKEHLK